MRPIAALTATARRHRRDARPLPRIPQPESDDEVAELARTLDQMLRELDAARTETEATIKRQREFVADASHELRTPLTSILANLELLEDALAGRGSPSDERGGRRLGAAQLEADEPARRRPAAARPRRRRAGRELRPSCDLARDRRRGARGGRAGRRRPRARRPDRPGRSPVDGDPDELHRMVLNLLENAIRHTPAGDRISAARRAAAATAPSSWSPTTAPGCPRAWRTQVFERFVRGEGPADRVGANGTGTGLGLSIVRAVAVAHGGRWSRRALQARRRPLHRLAAARGRADDAGKIERIFGPA